MTRLAHLAPVLLLAAAIPTQDPVKDLRSKSPETRLVAIDALAHSDRADADKQIASVLDDKDWEVQVHAAQVLGEREARLATKALVDLALGGEIAQLRRVAAEALGRIDPAEASKAILRKARAKTIAPAQWALAIIARGRPGLVDPARFKKLLRDEDAEVRESAAAAWLELAADRADALRALLADGQIALRCGALDQVARAPRADDLEPLVGMLAGGTQNDVVERRALTALAAVIRAETGDRAQTCKAVHGRLRSTGLTLARGARLVAVLAQGEGAVLDAAAAVTLLAPALTAESSDARAAAAKALREVGGDDALALALTRSKSDPSARVRLQLLDTVVALRGVDAPEEAAFVADLLQTDGDPLVRERAAVLLGRRGVKGAVSALTSALQDADWTVTVCAAVSLGKTGHDDALAPLLAIQKAPDWMRRGAAAIGLMHLNRAEVVEPLIGMLADPSLIVARTALVALQTIAWREDLGADPKVWRAWWQENRDKHLFRDRREYVERQKKYGYSVPDAEIYRGLDVVVYVSRGDHIEQLLDRLEITHRQTQANQVAQAAVHPEAIFVCNCTGEIEVGDVDPLAWFVRTGGYFFGSCWALSQTIEKIAPGVIRKFETPAGEVLDDVRARPCQPDSPFLNGVFPTDVVPIYHLEGAHLIEVLDPERAEVLIDSTDAAARHGSGNLAAWFRAGHGLVLDSVNHFDLQGLEVAQGLKTERDRQAYAIDHMGLSYANLREIQKESFWKSSPRAAKNVPDLSAFRFITNFVRMKRIGDQ